MTTLAEQFVRQFNATPRGDYAALNACVDWAAEHCVYGEIDEDGRGYCFEFRDGSRSHHNIHTQQAEVLSC